MKKIIATVIKEWLLLRRDVAGMLLLLLMPAVLIIIMALVQDAPFRDYQELRFDLLLSDNDGGSLSQEIKNGLRQSKSFHLIESINGKAVTDSMLKALLRKGDYKVGIIIPKGATAEVINSANLMANSLADKLGLGRLPAREHRDSLHLRLYFDPVTKPTFRASISFALDKQVTYSCSNLLVQRISRLSKSTGDTSLPTEDFKNIFAGVGIKEEVLPDSRGKQEHINATQHNVPAWAIFGMFFIAIPISGHMIREREEGSAMRVRLIPYAQAGVALGKIFFNTFICILQFILMCCIGIWILPLLGLPSLYLGLHPLALVPVTIAIAFAATAYGYFVGSVFKTANQALPFGAISIVILSAIGGIWVPVDLLPPILQKLALISPLHWGLDGIHRIILRDGNLKDVMMHIMVLLALGSLLWGLSMINATNREQSGQ